MGGCSPSSPPVPTPIHYQSVSIMLQSDCMMYKAVFSYMYNSAWIVNLYEGIAAIPVLRILEACGIAIVVVNEAFRQRYCKWHCGMKSLYEARSACQACYLKLRDLGQGPQDSFKNLMPWDRILWQYWSHKPTSWQAVQYLKKNSQMDLSQ